MTLFSQHSCAGFTLVEVMAVTVIVTLMTAVLLPVLVSSRRSARRNVCLSNLRQIGIATALYAQDADGLLPYAANATSKTSIARGYAVYGSSLDTKIAEAHDVVSTVSPYVSGSRFVFICPDDFLPRYLQNGAANGGDTFALVYGTSYQYDEEHALIGRSLDGYPRPSENLLWHDVGSFHDGDESADGLTNVLYADQHARAIPWSERTRALDEDP